MKFAYRGVSLHIGSGARKGRLTVSSCIQDNESRIHHYLMFPMLVFDRVRMPAQSIS